MIDEAAAATALNLSFDKSGISFHSRSETLAALKATGSEITYDEAGKPWTRYDHEFLELDLALIRFGMDQPQWADGRTLPRHGAPGRKGTMAKSDLKTIPEKVAWIAEHGEDAFARLPLTTPSSSEVRSQADWLKLPIAERARRWEDDPGAFERLPRAPKPDSPNTGKTHHAALEKELRTRGKR
ncbi:MAG: hypothetical protein JWM43_3906 [Acidobacteriaceae bacterium]|nr:hypothetical protein [Acidobacteriaceae bacterium]